MERLKKNVRVMKFGGSSLRDIHHVRQAAEQIQLHVKDQAVIVVVSAMGNSTDDLVSMAKEISSNPDKRELDMLLTAGERVSMSLMSLALNDLGVKAVSLTGSQAGLLTSNDHGDAELIGIKPFRVEQHLKEGTVVVLAGFQGVCPETKEVTTLGRGGSDLTAVAMAAHFESDYCEFRKDTEGLFDKDPHKDPKAQVVKHMSHDELIKLSQTGASCIHQKAASYAREKSVSLKFSHFSGKGSSTQVGLN